MHIFLTGERNIGKTTIIDKIISQLKTNNLNDDSQKKNNIGGFRSYFGSENELGKRYVYMSSADPDLEDKKSVPVSCQNKTAYSFEAYSDVFDTFGVSLLETAKSSDLIIMDELGFMESEAHLFKSKVFEILDGDVPVLGVIKPPGHEFTDRVRSHPQVKVVEMNKFNRDDLLPEILEKIL